MYSGKLSEMAVNNVISDNTNFSMDDLNFSDNGNNFSRENVLNHATRVLTDIALVLFNNFTNYTETNKSVLLLDDNSTVQENATASDAPEMHLVAKLSLTAILGIIILATVVGNVFVIAAILLERNLQTVGNYLVLSLAVADLMVALLVMPMGALYEVNQEWVLGPELCEIWTSGDVLCCTASILHLVAIAMDRYWAVTKVDYVRQRSSQRIGVMIFLVWAVGFLVSFAPVFGWKDEDFLYRIEQEKRCLVSQDAAYQIFATCATFYVPLIAILILYWRVYQVARKRIRHKPGAKSSSHCVQPIQKQMVHVVCSDNRNSTGSGQVTETTTTTTTNGTTAAVVGNNPKPKKKAATRENMEAKRERKAAKTLAIITGVFVICWLPFFLTALLMAVCGVEPDPGLFSFFLWLGYANSTLNPIIYTIFSPDFRSAFQRVLCGNKRRGRLR